MEILLLLIHYYKMLITASFGPSMVRVFGHKNGAKNSKKKNQSQEAHTSQPYLIFHAKNMCYAVLDSNP
jgi:hypothetical protein